MPQEGAEKSVTNQTTTKVEEGAMKRSRDASLAAPVATRAGWTDLDVRAVDTVRLLAADAVQKVGNGHPGTAMSLAPLAPTPLVERRRCGIGARLINGHGRPWVRSEAVAKPVVTNSHAQVRFTAVGCSTNPVDTRPIPVPRP